MLCVSAIFLSAIANPYFPAIDTLFLFCDFFFLSLDLHWILWWLIVSFLSMIWIFLPFCFLKNLSCTCHPIPDTETVYLSYQSDLVTFTQLHLMLQSIHKTSVFRIEEFVFSIISIKLHPDLGMTVHSCYNIGKQQQNAIAPFMYS